MRLLQSNHDVVVFTDEETNKKIQNFLYRNNILKDALQKMFIVLFDLDDQKWHEKITEIKHLNMIPPQRCLEVQYGKFEWVKNVSDNFSPDTIWWIDAGLLSDHLFPSYAIKDLELIFNSTVFKAKKIRLI